MRIPPETQKSTDDMDWLMFCGQCAHWGVLAIDVCVWFYLLRGTMLGIPLENMQQSGRLTSVEMVGTILRDIQIWIHAKLLS